MYQLQHCKLTISEDIVNLQWLSLGVEILFWILVQGDISILRTLTSEHCLFKVCGVIWNHLFNCHLIAKSVRLPLDRDKGGMVLALIHGQIDLIKFVESNKFGNVSTKSETFLFDQISLIKFF